MLKSLWLAGLILMAGAENLAYRATPASGPIQAEMTYSFAVTGPPTLTSQLLGGNPGLSIQQLRATRRGRRVISAAEDGRSRVEILVENAQVEGRTQDKPLQFHFDGGPAPADLAADPVRQFAWSLSVTPRRYTLGAKGDYRLDAGHDAQTEATGVILDAPIRLSDGAVNVGDEWSSDWTGNGRRKKDDAVFHYHQTARVEEIGGGAAPRARISFSTSGALRDSSGKNLQGEDTRLESKGSILLDVRTGTVVGVDSSGTITTDVKGAGLKVVFTYTSKYEVPAAQ
jgi:hypothetical protein